MTCHALTHETEARRHISLPVCPMKGVRYWSRMSTSTTDGSDFKNLASPSVQKQRREGKGEKGKN